MLRILMILLICLLIRPSKPQLICPFNSPFCSSTSYANKITTTCSRLGHLPQSPPTCDSPSPISKMVLSDVDTRIDNVQRRAFFPLLIDYLDLSRLQIGSYEAGAFDGLHGSLKTLFLSGNNISNVTAPFFTVASSIIELHLDSNAITALSGDVFKGMVALTTLNLSANLIEYLDGSMLKGLVNLQVLYLKNNYINAVPVEFFKGLNQLVILHLQQNEIAQLNGTEFTDLTSLRDFNISYNKLASLPLDLFAATASLNTLDASFNKINVIPVLSNLPGLIKLKFDHNLIDQVSSQVFFRLDNVEELYMNDNRINYLDRNSLAGIPRVKILSLQNNFIQNLRLGIFDPTGDVLYLDLSNNSIRELKSEIFSSQSRMQTLKIDGNLLTEINSNWYTSSSVQLKNLSASNNTISKIDPKFFEIAPLLTTVNLRLNQLTMEAIENATSRSTSSLTYLDLSQNPLKNMTNLLRTWLRNLERLVVDNTCLEEINISGMTQLKTISARSNAISEVWVTGFANITKLSLLDLSDNCISFVDPTIADSSLRISMLNLSNNYLDYISDISYNVDTVDLSRDRFTSLSEFPTFYQYFLYGNPLQCACSMLPTISGTSFMDASTAVCATASTVQRITCYTGSRSFCPSGNYTSTDATCSSRAAVTSPTLPTCNAKRASCQVDISENRTRTVLTAINSLSHCGQLYLQWAVNKVDSYVVGYNVSVDADPPFWIEFNASQTQYIVAGVNQTNATVCVQVKYTSLVLWRRPLCNTTVAKACPVNDVKAPVLTTLQIILYVVIPCVGALVIIVAIILIVKIVRKKKVPEKPVVKPQKVENKPSNNTYSKHFFAKEDKQMAEQNFTTVDLYTSEPSSFMY